MTNLFFNIVVMSWRADGREKPALRIFDSSDAAECAAYVAEEAMDGKSVEVYEILSHDKFRKVSPEYVKDTGEWGIYDDAMLATYADRSDTILAANGAVNMDEAVPVVKGDTEGVVEELRLEKPKRSYTRRVPLPEVAQVEQEEQAA